MTKKVMFAYRNVWLGLCGDVLLDINTGDCSDIGDHVVKQMFGKQRK